MNYKKFQELLITGKLQEVPDFKISESDTSKYFKTESGEILSFLASAKHIKTFASEEVFNNLVKVVSQSAIGRGHILEQYKAKVDKLEEHIFSEKLFLSEFLKIDLLKLDYSPQSLQKITTGLKKNKISYNEFFDNAYFPLVVYLGETIRLNNNGKWLVKPTEKYSALYVQLSTGEVINVFLDLYNVVIFCVMDIVYIKEYNKIVKGI